MLILFIIGVVLWLLIAPIRALAKAGSAVRTVEALERRLNRMDERLDELEDGLNRLRRGKPVAAPGTNPEAVEESAGDARDPDVVAPKAEPVASPPEFSGTSKIPEESGSVPLPPPLPASALHVSPVETTAEPGPPPLPETLPAPPATPAGSAEIPGVPARKPFAPAPSVASAPAFDWEQFLGAKLFSWIGGLALFIGVALGIKYSFDHGWISPTLRAVCAFATGFGLLGGGLALRSERYAVTRQTLVATGILVLYAATFACDAVWKFPVFTANPVLPFALMSLITAGAFGLAVKLDAKAVAVLGLAGGFLTPVLLSTGADHPGALFGYIALLDLGLIAVAMRRRWDFLVVLGAIGTVLTEIGWSIEFGDAGSYLRTDKIFVPMAVFLGFQALFTGSAFLAKRRGHPPGNHTFSALPTAFTALVAAAVFVWAPHFEGRPAIPFAFAFLVEGLVFLVAATDRRAAFAGPLAGGVVFLLLGAWTLSDLTPATLNIALGLNLVFALLHVAAPMTLKKLGRLPETPAWCHAFTLLTILLTLIPAFQCDSWLVWPLLLALDALAIVLAVSTSRILPVAAVAITFIAVAGTFTHITPEGGGLTLRLLLLFAISAGFTGLGLWLSPRFKTPGGEPEDIAKAVAPVSAILPFLLLLMTQTRLKPEDPSAIFTCALALSVMLFGVGRFLREGAFAPVALGGAVLLQYAWRGEVHPTPAGDRVALFWALGFCALNFVHPFVFHRVYAEKKAPWAASAFSLVLYFPLIHALLKTVAPHRFPGLDAAAFASPAFAGMALVAKRTPAESPARLGQLALFGGVALFFVTLIFPLQFTNEWLTISWALEGAALCALFRKVPHPGLRATGLALLLAAFVRLALNPGVLGYHIRGDVPVFNWYLGAYATVAVALSVAARLLREPRNRVGGIDVAPVLRALSAILAFLLLNIEIADYFAAPGTTTLAFDFSGNFARDMSYSLGWGLFALGMLTVGIVQRLRPPRYAALALLAVTLVKLFFHDLVNLDQLYRIGAFFGVAIAAILASFLYQKFLAPRRETPSRDGA